MNANNSSVFNVCFEASGKIYHAFSLRPQANELFLHFCYASQQRKYKDLDTQEITRRPDHFSWHIDGKGHLKISPDRKTQKGQFADGTFLPSGPADLSPLFIISHIKGEGTWEAKHIETPTSASYLLNIGLLEKFSILGFLLPSNMPITAFQYLYACFTPEDKGPVEIPLSDLFLLPFCHIRFSVYPGYDILIFISDLLNLDIKSIEQLEQQFGGGAYFSSTFTDINKALPTMLYRRHSMQ